MNRSQLRITALTSHPGIGLSINPTLTNASDTQASLWGLEIRTGIAEAKLAMDGIKLALDVIKSLQTSKAGADFKAQLIEARAAILDAQEHASAAYARETDLAERIRALEGELTRLETWNCERERYELVKATGGAVVYAIKESERGVEPKHYICPACYERGQKMIFQFARKYEGGPVHACPQCKLTVILCLQPTGTLLASLRYHRKPLWGTVLSLPTLSLALPYGTRL